MLLNSKISEPDDPASPVPAEEDLEIDPPTLEEVKPKKWKISWH